MKPDLLMLDEPTNHLDARAIMWLSVGTTASCRRSLCKHFIPKEMGDTIVVVVSHDRDFLNAVVRRPRHADRDEGQTTDIVRLKDCRLTDWPGNFDSYEQATADMQAKHRAQAEAVEKRRQQILKFIDAATKHARQTGDDKILGQVASRKKKLERLGAEKLESGKRFKLSYHATGMSKRFAVEVDTPDPPVKFDLLQPALLGLFGPVLELEDVTLGYGDKVQIPLGRRIAHMALHRWCRRS